MGHYRKWCDFYVSSDRLDSPIMTDSKFKIKFIILVTRVSVPMPTKIIILQVDQLTELLEPDSPKCGEMEDSNVE